MTVEAWLMVDTPEGYSRIAFRPVQLNEYFLSSTGQAGYQDGGVHFEENEKRVILVKKVTSSCLE